MVKLLYLNFVTYFLRLLAVESSGFNFRLHAGSWLAAFGLEWD